MARTVKGVAEAHGTTASLRFLDEGNPPTVNDPALARDVAVPALKRVFGEGAVRVEPQMVAEDFPSFGEKAPYFYFLLGTRNDAKGIASVNHTAAFDVEVANVAPTLTLSGLSQTFAGEPYVLELTRSDPGEDTLIGWVIDWGDGVVETLPGHPDQARLTYASPGAVQIRAGAPDEDGEYRVEPFALEVRPVPLQVSAFLSDCNGFGVRW